MPWSTPGFIWWPKVFVGFCFLLCADLCVGSSKPDSCLSNVEVMKSSVAVGPYLPMVLYFFHHKYSETSCLANFEWCSPWTGAIKDVVKILLFGADTV